MAGRGRDFTLQQARTVLHAIRDRVTALQRVQRELRTVKREITTLNRRHLNNGVVGEARLRVLRMEQRRLGEDARAHVSAINAAGAEIKGVDDGLIDFPTVVDGQPAYWCWRAGETDIEWWHPRAAGFAGRRPVADLADDA